MRMRYLPYATRPGRLLAQLASDIIVIAWTAMWVMVGSAVYAGRWMEEARRFAQRHHEQLRGRPVWLFSSGPIGVPLAPAEESADALKLVGELTARGHQTFAGRIDPSALGWVERTITRMVKAPDGDFRDWEAVRSWADDIARALARTEVEA